MHIYKLQTLLICEISIKQINILFITSCFTNIHYSVIFTLFATKAYIILSSSITFLHLFLNSLSFSFHYQRKEIKSNTKRYLYHSLLLVLLIVQSSSYLIDLFIVISAVIISHLILHFFQIIIHKQERKEGQEWVY